MSSLILLFFTFLGVRLSGNRTNFEYDHDHPALDEKFTLLRFSGPGLHLQYIKMTDTYFNLSGFKEFVDSFPLLVKADSPRLEQNEYLTEKYNTYRVFPLTLIPTIKDKVLNKFEDLPAIKIFLWSHPL